MKNPGVHIRRGKKGRHLLTLILILTTIKMASGQSALTAYTEFGENNVSNGVYLRSAALLNLATGKYSFGIGIQSGSLIPGALKVYGLSFNAVRTILIKKTPVLFQGFYVMTDLTEMVHEKNWGGSLKLNLIHFEMTLGTNFRTFSFSNKAQREYKISNDAASIHETFNIIYSFGYNIRPSDNKWNIGLAVTDIDYFHFNQETNPIFKLNGYLRFSDKISINADLSYEMAGFTNLAIGYFGLTLKTGLIWNF
jgi:hypothetical protein